jgi:hypothetical protein
VTAAELPISGSDLDQSGYHAQETQRGTHRRSKDRRGQASSPTCQSSRHTVIRNWRRGGKVLSLHSARIKTFTRPSASVSMTICTGKDDCQRHYRIVSMPEAGILPSRATSGSAIARPVAATTGSGRPGTEFREFHSVRMRSQTSVNGAGRKAGLGRSSPDPNAPWPEIDPVFLDQVSRLRHADGWNEDRLAVTHGFVHRLLNANGKPGAGPTSTTERCASRPTNSKNCSRGKLSHLRSFPAPPSRRAQCRRARFP